MTAEMVAQVRRFNRTVTQRIGVLNENFLASDRSLGQNRLLWEIGADGCDIRSLRARLDLDSGYVSRLLRALEAGGLIAIEQNADRRPGPHRAAHRGRPPRTRRAGPPLRRSRRRRYSQPLNARQRDRLVTAMEEVERLLIASTVEVRECDPRDADARFCLQTYYSELAVRFRDGYDPAVSPVADAEMTPPAGLLLVASLHGEPVGCGALIFYPDDVGLVKRMWVAPFRPRVGPRPPVARRTRGPRPRRRCAPHAAGDQGRAHRGRPDVPNLRLSRSRPLQRRALRRPLVRKALV